jgi:hypothetical protein
MFLAWVIVGSVELRGGFLGAHGYKTHLIWLLDARRLPKVSSQMKII